VFHLFLFFSLYMGKKRIHAGIAASTSESPATIAMFTHDSMPHYPDTTPRRPRSPRSERVVRLGTNSPTCTLFGGKEGNKNYKHLGTELLDINDLKNVLVMTSSFKGSASQGLEGPTLCCHIQWRRRERPISFRSGTPRPPIFSGHCILLHTTKHFPPCTSFVPVHMNALKIFSKAQRSQAGSS
jgi:hypothetical protein